MNKSPIFLLFPLLTHATGLFLILFVLISPSPFSISSVSLLKVEPFTLNSSTPTSPSTSNFTSSANSSLVFGGSSTASSMSSSETASQISETSRSSPHSSSTPSSSLESSKSSTSSSAAPSPTSNFVLKRSPKFQSREELSNMTGSGGIHLNSTDQSLLSNATAYQNSFSSKVELVFGPLGSCFSDGNGDRVCTSAKLSPSYDSDKLKQKDFGSFVTSGLLDRLPTTPILLLVVLIVLILTLGINTLITLTKLVPSNPTVSTFLEAGQRQRGLAAARKYSIYASTVSWLILLCSIVSMRIYSSKAATSFNASNLTTRSLPANLVLVNSEDGNVNTSNVMGMKAKVGSGFTLLWITLALMGSLLYLERRSLKNDQAIAQARSDIEARHGRFAFTHPNGDMRSVEVKPVEQLPYSNQNQPYGSSFDQYPSSSSIYNGYPVSSYGGGKSRSSSPTSTTNTRKERAVSPAPTYRGGGINTSSSRSYWVEEKTQEPSSPEPMSWSLVGDRTGHHYN